MDIRIAGTFTASLAKLTGDELQAAKKQPPLIYNWTLPAWFVLEQMSQRYPYTTYSWQNPLRDEKIDTRETWDYLKAIHILALNGAKWIPNGKSTLNSARKSLLRLKAEYTVEFVWIMNKFKACERSTIDPLLGTSSMTAHTAVFRRRLKDVLTSWD